MTETSNCPICWKQPDFDKQCKGGKLVVACYHRCKGVAYFELEKDFNTFEDARKEWNLFIDKMKQ